MTCSELSKQQLYLVGMSTSVSFYILITSAFSMSNYPIRRNLHLLLSSITSIINCIVALYINLGISTKPDPSGLNVGDLQDMTALNVIPLLMSVLFASLAGLHRYTSYLEDRARILSLSILSGIFVIFFVICIVLALFNTVVQTPVPATSICVNSSSLCCLNQLCPVQPSFVNTIKMLTVVVPFIHIFFSTILLISKLRSEKPKQPRTFQQNLDSFSIYSTSMMIASIWFVYIVVELQPLSNIAIHGSILDSSLFVELPSMPGLDTSGVIGTVYMVCHNFALLCENSILSSSLNLNGDSKEDDDDGPRDNFFTTTMATGQDQQQQQQ